MKYLFLKDCRNVYKKNNKILILYYLVLIVVICLQYFIKQETLRESFFFALGLNVNWNFEDILEVIVHLLNLGFFCYMASIIQDTDLNSEMENIFLRTQKWKWYLSKIMITMLVFILLLLPVYLCFSFVSNICFIYLKNILFVMLIGQIGCFLYHLYQTKFILFLIALVALFVCCFRTLMPVIDISVLSLSVLNVIFIGFNYINLKYNYSILLEKE